MSEFKYFHSHSEPTQKVGSVVKTHGYKGFIKLFFDNDDFEDLALQQDFLYVVRQGRWVPFKIEEVNSKHGAIKLTDFQSDTDVLPLLNAEIVLPVSLIDSLPKEQSIINFELHNQDGLVVGEITDIIDMPGHTLLEVQSTNGNILIPFHESLVLQIEEEAQILTLQIAEGLLDL